MATTTVSITITAPQASDITNALNSFVYQNGYQDILSDGSSNPETKAAFGKRITQEFWKNSIKAYNSKAASSAAIVTATNSVDSTYAFS